MKTRIIASTLLIMLLAVGISSNADAARWRGRYCGPRCGVRVVAPRVAIGILPVLVGGYYPRPYYGGYYAGPAYYGGPRYYGGRGYYGGYGPRAYGHGYYGGRGYRR